MPQGKPAGVPCVQLDESMRCRLFGLPERPAFCVSLRPQLSMCGEQREQALGLLARLELETDPNRRRGGARTDGDQQPVTWR